MMAGPDLIGRFSNALYEGKGSLFIGSGISSGSGAPGWEGALQKLAKEKLDIEVKETDNLPLIAQYIVNRDVGNRGALIGELRSIYLRQLRLNRYHEALRLMNVQSIWTTNYDTLLEETFSDQLRAVHITDDNLSRPVPNAEIEIIKMHGCISGPHKDIVITQQDYEDYEINRPVTVQRLRHDFLTRSFLFLGYSYRDSNVSTMMTIARRLSGTATQSHFMVTLRKKDNPLLPLWHSDLRRVGIEVVLVDEYKELEDMLFTIAKKSLGRTVYFTGSHNNQSSDEAEYSAAVGRLLAEMDSKGKTETVVMDGQSTGRSRAVVSAFLTALMERKADVRRHLRYHPNPYAANPAFANDRALLPTLKQWRRPLMKATQLVVAFDGGMGTQAEVELAQEHQCRILPVPREKNGSALKLLEDKAVTDRINACCPEYVAKAKAYKLKAEDVAGCVHAMLNS